MHHAKFGNIFSAQQYMVTNNNRGQTILLQVHRGKRSRYLRYTWQVSGLTITYRHSPLVYFQNVAKTSTSRRKIVNTFQEKQEYLSTFSASASSSWWGYLINPGCTDVPHSHISHILQFCPTFVLHFGNLSHCPTFLMKFPKFCFFEDNFVFVCG